MAVHKKRLTEVYVMGTHYLLRKQAYSNTVKILLQRKKNESFQLKNSYIFHISAQKLDCGTR